MYAVSLCVCHLGISDAPKESGTATKSQLISLVRANGLEAKQLVFMCSSSLYLKVEGMLLVILK